MKKRILAILLCLCLCLGLVPGVALADDGPAVPQARVKYYNSDDNTFDAEYLSTLSFPANTNHDVAFFAPDGTEPLSGYDVVSANEEVVTVNPRNANGVDYVSLTGVGSGGTNLMLMAPGGVITYKFHVTVTPAEGGGGGGGNEVQWPSQLPCLYYKGFNPMTGQLHDSMPQFSMSIELGYSVPAAIFCHFGEGEEDVLITPDRISVTRGEGNVHVISASANSDYSDYLDVSDLALGEVSIQTTVRVANQDVTLSLPVTVSLPEWGFYTVPSIDLDKRVRGQVTYGTEEGQYTTVYLVRNGGIPAQSTTGSGQDVPYIAIDDSQADGENNPYLSTIGEWVETSAGSGLYHLKITLPAPADDPGSYSLNVFVPGTPGVCGGFGDSFQVALPGHSGPGPGPGPGPNQPSFPSTPCLYWKWAEVHHDTFNGVNGPAQFQMGTQPDNSWDVVLFCHTEDEELQLTLGDPGVTASIADTSVATLEDRGPYCRIFFRTIGDTELSVTLTLDGQETTLTLPIQVNMPDHGFFAKPANSDKPVFHKDSLVTTYEFAPDEESVTLYLMGTEALSQAPYVVMETWPENTVVETQAVAGVEGVEYCYACVLPNPGLDDQCYVTARSEDSNDATWLANVRLSCWSDELPGAWRLTLSDGLNYGLELGERWNNEAWPANTQSCRLPGQSTEMDLPFLLWCRDRNEEASAAAYTEFWSKYTLSVTCPNDRQSGDVTVSITGTGANTRVGITADGPWAAKVLLVATPKSEDDPLVNSYALFRYGEPTYLTDDDGDGVYHIPSLPGRDNDWFAIDLGQEVRAKVSAQGTMANDLFGSLSLDMGDGTNEPLWWKSDQPDQDGSYTRSNTVTLTARYLLLNFSRWSMDEPASTSTASADITVELVLPSLKAAPCRVTDGNVSPGTSYTDVIRAYPGGTQTYLFGYGYPEDVAPLAATAVTSSAPAVIQAELIQGNDDISYAQLTFLQEGTATLTVTAGGETYTMEAVCALPQMAFYSKAERSGAAILPSRYSYAQLTDGKLYFIAPDDLDLSDIEFHRDDTVLPASAVEEVTLTGYTCAVITPGEPEENASFEVSVWEAGQDGRILLDIRLYPAEVPAPDPNEYLGSSYPFEYDGQDWLVGFTFEIGDVIMINEGTWRYGQSVWGEQDPTAERYEFREMKVAAGIKVQETPDSMPYYLPNEEGTVGLEVIRMWLEPLNDTEECGDCLSWVQDANAAVKTKSSGFADNVSAPLYARFGYAADVRVWARVRISIPGQAPVEENVSVIAWLYRTNDYNYTRPDGDTLADLQTALNNAAKLVDPDIPNQVFSFELGDTAYAGTLVIPAAFAGDVSLYINGYQGQYGLTSFTGGIDLNGGELGGLRDISFTAPAAPNNGSLKSAVFNGTLLNMDCCLLQNYDVALDASNGSMKYARNVFVNNKIAVRVDLDGHCNGGNLSAMEGNSFIKNEVAVQWITFSPNFIPYYYRIVESNFIGNTLDFDMKSPNTVVYQYRNYYGKDVGNKLFKDLTGYLNDLLNATSVSQISGLATRRRPQMNVVQGSIVVTNPRWKFPVNDWWHHNQLIDDVFPGSGNGNGNTALTPVSLMGVEDDLPYADLNVLVADWDESTIILNDEADSLILDASAFDEEADSKVIDVVDREGTGLGSWAFPDTSAQAAQSAAVTLMEARDNGPAAPSGFNAALDIAPVNDDSDDFVVTVVASDVLTSHTPTLTLPCCADWENAAVTGPDGEAVQSAWDDETKSVTFVVAMGGDYTVTSAEAEDEPSQPIDPVPTPPAPPAPPVPSTPAVTTETTTNEDGSVTTTVTDSKTGTVTETTVKEDEDGSKTETVVVTDKEGNVTTTETVTEPDGKVIETVTDPEGDKTLTVTDPEGQVAAAIELPAQLPTLPEEEKFTDVPEDHWAAEAIDNMAALGLVQGVSTEERTYDMTGSMTRGTLASILFRFANGTPGLEAAFTDVSPEDWYADGVAWAAKNGIVNGYSPDLFGPEDTITRQQLAVMLCRFIRFLGMDVSAGADALAPFTDAAQVSDWAVEGMAWCVETGILQGKGGGVLDPTASLTRAEGAVILDRLIALLSA